MDQLVNVILAIDKIHIAPEVLQNLFCKYKLETLIVWVLSDFSQVFVKISRFFLFKRLNSRISPDLERIIANFQVLYWNLELCI